MKSAALILATLALAATSEAGRITGTCYIQVVNPHDFVKMDCKATLPDGSRREGYKTEYAHFLKTCAKDGSICWQINSKVPQNVDIFYANTVRQVTGTVSDHSETPHVSSWRNTYSVDF
ncbi:MAG: hypothetical protein J3R72DRAFT_458892 [Linnemannia gamsii]|nr:MAG: hypothetical protein J3R72DRAFT_458892 [Linnemannia gamsii]